MKKVMITGFKILINITVTTGKVNQASGAGPFSSIIDDMFAIAFGVCPSPTPQCQAAITAAS
jgi:hypothetical protein